MSALLNKMLNFVGLEAEEYEVAEGENALQNNSGNMYESSKTENNKKSGKLVNMPSLNQQVKLVIVQPEVFEDAQDICDHLKSKKPVVINLESIDNETARRMVDFLSGAVYGLDGNIQKVSNSIFLIAPHNIDILNEFKDELKNKGVFPWLK